MTDLTEAIEAAQHETATSLIARIAVQAAAPIIERQVRAETAEGIAQAIEARGRQSHDYLDRAELPANPRYAETIVLTIEQAASIARGYTQPAETPGQDS